MPDRDVAPADTQLPTAVRSIWGSLRLGFRAEPRLIVVVALTTVAGVLPDALLAVALAALTSAATDGDSTDIVAAAGLLAVLAVLVWLLQTVSDRANRRFAERAAAPIEAHVARLHTDYPGLELFERPEYVERTSLLRDHAATLSELYRSLFTTVALILRLVLIMLVLMAIRPSFGLLALLVIPGVVVSNWRGGVEKAVEERTTQEQQRARGLFLLGVEPGPGKEVRTAGVEDFLRDRRASSWERRYRPLARARYVSAVFQAGATGLYGLAFVVALGSLVASDASIAAVVLLIAAAGRLAQYVNDAVGETHFLRSIWLEGSRRLAWLETISGDHDAAIDESTAAVPRGVPIRFEGVSFAYPGTNELVLDNVSLDLPANGVVAIVGENGAGKSSLVKLLCGFYQPTEGRILIGNVELERLPTAAWRRRLSATFQDFFNFEFTLRRAVELGDLDDDARDDLAPDALALAGASELIDRLPAGLETQLGVGWTDGHELSQGQWQKVAMARCFARRSPSLLILDEPTSALDAVAEHDLFVRYSEAARRSDGAKQLTVLISHRFSTVRMADLIVVLNRSKVVEIGSHEQLIEQGGLYSELYSIQSESYS